MRVLITSLTLLSVGSFLADRALAVAPPPPPPYLRVLHGENRKSEIRLLKEIDRLEAADQYKEALLPARELAALRSRIQGRGHWQAVNAEWEVRRLAIVAELSPEQRSAYAKLEILAKDAVRLDNQGRFRQGEPIHRRVLEGMRKALGEEHPSTAWAYNNLAFCLTSQRKFEEGRRLHETTLRIRRKTLGEEHPDTAMSYNNVAYCLNGQGKTALALPMYEKVYAMQRRLLGDKHLSTLVGLNNVAAGFFGQHEYAQALPLFERALATCLEIRGEKHPDTAQCYGSIALCLSRLGKPDSAVPHFEKALAIYLETLGEKHLRTVESCRNLADCLRAQGKHTLAQPYYEKALAIYREWGQDESETASAYKDLADCLREQGRHSRALPYYEKALAIRRRALGEDNPDTVGSTADLAICLDSQGKYAQALPLFEQALANCRKTWGEEHIETAACYNNLASCLEGQYKFVEAQPLYEKAIAIERKRLAGEKHARLATGYNNLANCLHGQGKFAQEQVWAEKALAIRLEVLGADHSHTASSYNNLARCLSGQGKKAEALALYEKALATCRRVEGEEHPYTALCHANVASCMQDKGAYAEAATHYEKALDSRRKLLGEDHPDTASSYLDMAGCLVLLGKNRLAEQMAERASRSFEAARLHVGNAGLDRSAFAAKHSPHIPLACLRAGAGKAEAAWEAMERHFARGLLDEIAARERVMTAEERQTLDSAGLRLQFVERQILSLSNKRDKESRGQREQLRKQRDGVGRELRELQSRLAKENGPIAGAVYDLERIQRSLPDDEAILGWLDVLDQTWACLVRRRGPPVWVRLPATDFRDLRFLVVEVSRRPSGAAPKGEPAWLAPARRLYAQRLAPLQKHLNAGGGLPRVRRLVVLPTRLITIPVETMLLAGNADLAVSYTPSATFFASLRQPRKKGDANRPVRMLGLGDPQFLPGLSASSRGSAVPEGGIYLTRVSSGGSAARAGLRDGDVLLTYAGVAITSFEGLMASLRKHAGGKEDPAVGVWREGKVIRPKVRPGPLGVEVSRLPAAEAVRLARDADGLVRGALRKSFAPLPGTRGEVKAIAALFTNSDTLIGAGASEQALDELSRDGKLKGYRFLHLATHGEASARKPLESFLALSDKDLPDPLKQVLAGKPAYNGRLTAGHILQSWKLDADLVVLSACQSGLGRYESGEGYVGFAQPLFAVGARSVVMSLWSVDDTATALLMVRFYRNLLGKRDGLKAPMSKADALNEAKRWLRSLTTAEADKALAALSLKRKRDPEAKDTADRPYAHPFYWAAFILAGDPGGVNIR